MSQPIVGIIGGMGPQAGIYLADRIVANTIASIDGDHLPVALLSYPSQIADRTEFLTGASDDNPATGILDVAKALIGLGARVLGMPCNTAHAPPIRSVVDREIEKLHKTVRFLHLIEETAAFVREVAPAARRIGILATPGTYQQKLYEHALRKEGLDSIVPTRLVQDELIYRAIYDPHFGIKSASDPVTHEATDLLSEAAEHLQKAGAEALVLGCTELPLAVPETRFTGIPVIDSTTALARALIREVDPLRLVPLK